MRKLYLLMLFAFCSIVSNAQRAPKAINDVARIYENGTVVINVLANDSNFNQPDSVCLTSVWGGATGWATVQGCMTVTFHPLNPTFVGVDTFYYRSCDQLLPALCDTGRVIVTVLIEAPKALNDTATLIQGDSITMNVLANDSNFNPQDSIRITGIWGAPAGWATILDSTQVKVRSTNPNFYGLVYIRYRSCDTRVVGLCDTGTAVVNIIRTPRAYLDSASLIQPDTAFINVLANDSDLNALDSTCITNIWGMPTGWATVQGCGQIVFNPTNFNYFGSDTFYYRSCYTQIPTLCDTAKIVVQVILPKPQVDFLWTEDSPCVAQVANNSTLTDSVKWVVSYLTNNGHNDTLYNASQFSLAATMVDSAFEAQVCLTGFNPAGDTTICYTFWIQCSLSSGIRQIADSHLSVYPDPASDRIFIDMSKVDRSAMGDASMIVIYDMIGQELRSIPLREISNAISVSDLSAGIYLIGIKDGQNRNVLSKFEVMR